MRCIVPRTPVSPAPRGRKSYILFIKTLFLTRLRKVSMDVKGKFLVTYGRKCNMSLHTGRFAHQAKNNDNNQLFAMPRGEKSSRRRLFFALLPKVSMEVRSETLIKYEGKSLLTFRAGVEKCFLLFPGNRQVSK